MTDPYIKPTNVPTAATSCVAMTKLLHPRAGQKGTQEGARSHFCASRIKISKNFVAASSVKKYTCAPDVPIWKTLCKKKKALILAMTCVELKPFLAVTLHQILNAQHSLLTWIQLPQ
eukprot:6290472-Amphidinium_carterae.1